MLWNYHEYSLKLQKRIVVPLLFKRCGTVPLLHTATADPQKVYIKVVTVNNETHSFERLCIKMKKYVTAYYFRNLIYISFGREKNQILKMAWKRHKNVPRSVIDLRLDLPFPSH